MYTKKTAQYKNKSQFPEQNTNYKVPNYYPQSKYKPQFSKQSIDYKVLKYRLNQSTIKAKKNTSLEVINV